MLGQNLIEGFPWSVRVSLKLRVPRLKDRLMLWCEVRGRDLELSFDVVPQGIGKCEPGLRRELRNRLFQFLRKISGADGHGIDLVIPPPSRHGKGRSVSGRPNARADAMAWR